MKQVNYRQGKPHTIIPELFIDGEKIDQAGFTTGEIFKIEQRERGLIITLLEDDGEIERLITACDIHHNSGLDWVRENGELYLAGEWLTQTGLAGQPLAISVLYGQVIIERQ